MPCWAGDGYIKTHSAVSSQLVGRHARSRAIRDGISMNTCRGATRPPRRVVSTRLGDRRRRGEWDFEWPDRVEQRCLIRMVGKTASGALPSLPSPTVKVSFLNRYPTLGCGCVNRSKCPTTDLTDGPANRPMGG